MNNRTAMNRESNELLQKLFSEKGIFSCEVAFAGCNRNFGLNFAHKKKRRHYKTVEELSEFNEVCLCCLKCHIILEQNPVLTKETFARLRP